MEKRERSTMSHGARLIDLPDLAEYLSLGKNKAAEFGKECGAEKHIGRRCLYDRKVIDEALDKIAE